MKKFDLPKLKSGKLVGYVIAIGMGVGAVINELLEQKREKDFEDLTNRVAELEKAKEES